MAANFPRFFPFGGFGLVNFKTLNSWFNNPQTSYQDTITAYAGGGQANAVQLLAAKNRVSVCATAADSVKLPRSSLNQGGQILVINDGAANLAVFPYDTATIDGGAASASVTITAGRRAFFWSVGAGKWQSGGMAKTT